MLLGLGAPLLALGLYGVGVGIMTLTWPRAQAVILAARIDVREEPHMLPGSDKVRGGRIETREAATLHLRYRYRIEGRQHEGSAVEPADFGLQTAAAAREQGMAYPPGSHVTVAYDPRDAARAYLRPGPSGPAVAFLVAGGALMLFGLWARRR